MGSSHISTEGNIWKERVGRGRERDIESERERQIGREKERVGRGRERQRE